jgi:hypothetical protein
VFGDWEDRPGHIDMKMNVNMNIVKYIDIWYMHIHIYIYICVSLPCLMYILYSQVITYPRWHLALGPLRHTALPWQKLGTNHPVSNSDPFQRWGGPGNVWKFPAPPPSIYILGGGGSFLYRFFIPHQFPQGCDRLGCPAKACWFTIDVYESPAASLGHDSPYVDLAPINSPPGQWWMIMRSRGYHVELEAAKYVKAL